MDTGDGLKACQIMRFAFQVIFKYGIRNLFSVLTLSMCACADPHSKGSARNRIATGKQNTEVYNTWHWQQGSRSMNGDQGDHI